MTVQYVSLIKFVIGTHFLVKNNSYCTNYRILWQNFTFADMLMIFKIVMTYYV